MRLYHYLKEAIGTNIMVKKTSECSKEEVTKFFKLIDFEKQAFTSVATIRKQAAYIAFAYVDDSLAAVSSLKKPYRAKEVLSQAGIPELISKVKYEIGWTVTLPEYRGKRLNYLLHRALFDTAGDTVFGTVRDNNTASLGLVNRLGMKQVGIPFEGLGNYNILTFVYGG